VARHWQQGLQGGLCEERLGLPCAGGSRFQLVPAGSRWFQQVPQRTHRRAQLSPSAKSVAGASGKTSLVKGRIARQAKE